MNKALILSVAFFLYSLFSISQVQKVPTLQNPLVKNAQEKCATMENLEMLKAQDPGLEKRMQLIESQIQNFIQNKQVSGAYSKQATLIVIPVVFHVVYNGASQNISTAQVLSQLDVLNEDFRRLNADTVNTPPVFSIYVSMLNLRWLKSKGGVAEIEKENIGKAEALYREIDRNPFFKGTCAVEDRSRMNVCFVMENPEFEKPFLKMVEERGIIGIKGHRSVGGFRASIYNALPITSIHVLIDAMQDFAEEHR